MVELGVPELVALPSSVVFLAGLALGILLGYQYCRRRVRTELKVLRERLIQLETAVRQGAPRPKSESFSEASSCSLGSIGMELECAMLNEALWHLWPYLADIAKSVLFGEVESRLQALVPKAISGITFSRTECHFGSTPIQIRKLLASGNKEGSWDNLTFTVELVHNGDCHLELGLPNTGTRFLGACTGVPAAVGISSVKFRGTLIVELTNLVPRVPLVNGLRVYFINPPVLDLTMTGGFSGLLNVSLVKQKIIEAVLKVMSKQLVLPQLVTWRFAREIDVFKLSAPQPEGILRLEIADVTGEAFGDDRAASRRLYLRLILGDRDWQTVLRPSASCRGAPVSFSAPVQTGDAEGGSVVDLEVHKGEVQQLCIQVYSEETSRLWGGARRGHLLAQSLVSCHDLMEVQDAWWPLVHAMDNSSWLETRYSVAVTSDGSAGHAQVRLRSEWRPYGSAATAKFPVSREEQRLKGWQLCKEVGAGATSLLLVGVTGACNLPHELARYWCVVDCLSSGRHCNQSTQAEQGHLVSVSCEQGVTVEADWEKPLLYRLEDPREATVTFTVFHASRSSAKDGVCLGSAVFCVDRLLRCEGLRESVRKPLQLHSKSLLRLAEEASGIPPTPIEIEAVLQLWLLGSPQGA